MVLNKVSWKMDHVELQHVAGVFYLKKLKLQLDLYQPVHQDSPHLEDK